MYETYRDQAVAADTHAEELSAAGREAEAAAEWDHAADLYRAADLALLESVVELGPAPAGG